MPAVAPPAAPERRWPTAATLPPPGEALLLLRRRGTDRAVQDATNGTEESWRYSYLPPRPIGTIRRGGYPPWRLSARTGPDQLRIPCPRAVDRTAKQCG